MCRNLSPLIPLSLRRREGEDLFERGCAPFIPARGESRDKLTNAPARASSCAAFRLLPARREGESFLERGCAPFISACGTAHPACGEGK